MNRIIVTFSLWALGLAVCSPAFAGQTINTTSTTSCSAQSGMLTGGNLIVDFDNGTFGVEDGSPDQSPAQSNDPYPSQVSGGVFDHFYDFNWGDYGYIANAVTPRNPYQHADITDPVYGDTGRFFASDPNANTPILEFTVFSVTPFQNYEVSFWAANSEPNGTPNNVDAVVDGIVSYSTGDLIAYPSALEWRRHAFVFNAGDRTTVEFAIASTETGSGGRDFYLDNIEMQTCDLGPISGSIEGRIYSDSDGNNVYSAGIDGTISSVTVDLWNTQGDSDPSNDIYVSTITSGPHGIYAFSNLAPSANYELRVNTIDPNLPSGSTPGTLTTLPVIVTTGSTSSSHDFGFDVSLAFLEASKTVKVYDPLSVGLYAVPGNDVIYTISVVNRGGGNADNDSLFLVDFLPDDVTFYNGDMDVSTVGPVKFEQSGTGLTFDNSLDVGYAMAGPAPTNMSECSLMPGLGYIAVVSYVCFAPKGTMQGGNPDPIFALSFRTRID